MTLVIAEFDFCTHSLVFVWDSSSFHWVCYMRFLQLPLELLYLLLTKESFWVPSWFCCSLKSPSLNFNQMMSAFGIVSSHWCWTLWFLLLNSNYYHCYYKFLGMMGIVAYPFKFCTSSTWNSPLQIKAFHSRNAAFLSLTWCFTGVFYMSASEFTFSCYCFIILIFLFHISFTLLAVFSRKPYCINFQNG